MPIAVRDHAERWHIAEGEAAAKMASQNLLGRVIEAVDVARAITFLASPMSVAINGDAVAVGGGVPGAIHY
jgi:enoyl-[acyl-carrier-protein] reductase (NADH)